MFKPTKSVEVFYDKRKVGTLALRPDNLCAFEYDAKWIENGFSISPLFLPLQSGHFQKKFLFWVEKPQKKVTFVSGLKY